ncbi:MAG: F0F1 ATP synthase subunit A [Bacteroidales bacterium]|nr:F0F1 ATP synthase subunit A [Bacteroidales bacterium]
MVRTQDVRVLTFLFFLFLVLLVFPDFPAHASGPFHAAQEAGVDSTFQYDEDLIIEHEFDAGKMIMEHVVDNHEWHIATLGHTHVTIPLPIIVLYDGKIHTFWSSRFHNAEHTYNGFVLEKGKIHPEAKSDKPLYDFSITKTVMAILISSILLLWIFISIANRYKRNPKSAPKGMQSLLEPLIIFIRDDIAKSSIGEKSYEKFMPFLLTIFFFIFLNNLMGIIPIFPGGANVTGNIAITMVLAIFTFVLTTINGNRHYWVDIINTPGVPWWLKLPIPLMPVVEIVGIITKPFVLMVRLFANMAAGHIIVLGFVSLVFIFGSISVALGYGVSVVSVAFIVFMDLLEILVAFIQAYVFTLLSALYFGLATIETEKH